MVSVKLELSLQSFPLKSKSVTALESRLTAVEGECSASLWCSICSALCVVLCSVQLCSDLFCSVQLCSDLFCPVQLCSDLFCSAQLFRHTQQNGAVRMPLICQLCRFQCVSAIHLSAEPGWECPPKGLASLLMPVRYSTQAISSKSSSKLIYSSSLTSHPEAPRRNH